VYAAGEAPIPGVTGRTVVEAAHLQGATHVEFAAGMAAAAAAAAAQARKGDVIITLGAGDISRLGDEILGNLRALVGAGGGNPT